MVSRLQLQWDTDKWITYGTWQRSYDSAASVGNMKTPPKPLPANFIHSYCTIVIHLSVCYGHLLLYLAWPLAGNCPNSFRAKKKK